MISNFEKLKNKILKDTGLEVENMKRLYTGRQMKSTGSWSWISNLKESNIEVGSSHTVKELLKFKTLESIKGFGFSEYEIIEKI